MAAREHVRVARRLAELPLIREAFGAGRLSYSKVRALTRVEEVEREQELLDLARHATAAQLERVVRAYRGVVAVERAAHGGRPERWVAWEHDDDGSLLLRARLPAEDAALAGGSAARTGGDRHQVVVHVDATALNGHGRGARCELDGGGPLAQETARRLACDASVVALVERDGRAVSVGRKTRSVPPALRRALGSRDGGCRFPGCGARRFVDAHHIEHWAHGGDTSLGNLVQLCRHHHRLVHEGGYSVARDRGGGLTFRRPDGRRIVACPAAPPGRIAGVRAARRPGDRPRPAIEPDACVSLSAGERMNLEYGVEAVLTFAPIGAAAPPGI